MKMRARGGLTITGVALGAALAACGDLPRTGNVALQVLVGSPEGTDANLTEVRYEMTGTGFALAGRIQTPLPSVQFTKLISHVPVGDGYVVRVTARSADATLTCDGMARASVRRGATTPVMIRLTCRGVNDGQVRIVVGVKCPAFRVESYTISPLVASVGGTIAVSATTTDIDGGATAFSWTASTGAFASPTESHTTYLCAKAATVVLTLSVSSGACQDSLTVAVTCVSDAGVSDGDAL